MYLCSKMAACMAYRNFFAAKSFDQLSFLRGIFSKCHISTSIPFAAQLQYRCIYNRIFYRASNQNTPQRTFSQQLSFRHAANLSNSWLCKTDQSQGFHTSWSYLGLEEFFDDPKTYGEPNVKSGRPWSADELRLKDNLTLHKLWFVLLKEKNMLLTMEREAEKQNKRMPGSDRLWKVSVSMRKLQQVVHERNEALTELRTGQPEEHPGKMVYTPFGYLRYIKPKEHFLPIYANKRYHRKRYRYRPFVKKYLTLWMEKEQVNRKREKRRRNDQIKKLKQRFPDADVWQN
ncbi:39S ribosomal protein L47, mitochondrial-like [Acanthaster planci]|uniref:Large ribosomal subunit protein uL29m n=1 Tax=Acanthaster planci TaxID=133434 RepID=A0A8B7ZYM7_ACAPL|nr:39S ribosomal protein L47, mitochondrial-like [Acanthaster planci]